MSREYAIRRGGNYVSVSWKQLVTLDIPSLSSDTYSSAAFVPDDTSCDEIYDLVAFPLCSNFTGHYYLFTGHHSSNNNNMRCARQNPFLLFKHNYQQKFHR
jgi:hypothetical protein